MEYHGHRGRGNGPGGRGRGSSRTNNPQNPWRGSRPPSQEPPMYGNPRPNPGHSPTYFGRGGTDPPMYGNPRPNPGESPTYYARGGRGGTEPTSYGSPRPNSGQSSGVVGGRSGVGTEPPSYRSPRPNPGQSSGVGGGRSGRGTPQYQPVSRNTGSKETGNCLFRFLRVLFLFCVLEFLASTGPDKGGQSAIRLRKLLVSHFKVKFDPQMVMLHYNIDSKLEKKEKNKAITEVSKSDALTVKNKLFADNATQFPSSCIANYGKKNIYSAIELPTGIFKVVVSKGVDVSPRTYTFTIQLVKSLELNRIYDYSVIPSRKQEPVLTFLQEHVRYFDKNVPLSNRKLKRDVVFALKGLKVAVNHRRTNQKFVVTGLTRSPAYGTEFPIDDPADVKSKRMVGIVEYFVEKYEKDIVYKHLPCLDLSRNNRMNYVPMEFCELVKGQRLPKGRLPKEVDQQLKKMSLASPSDRRKLICDMIEANDGPAGNQFLWFRQCTMLTWLHIGDGSTMKRERVFAHHLEHCHGLHPRAHLPQHHQLFFITLFSPKVKHERTKQSTKPD